MRSYELNFTIVTKGSIIVGAHTEEEACEKLDALIPDILKNNDNEITDLEVNLYSSDYDRDWDY
ncbi:MAG: hypothetical protein FWF59_12125 [Turicibacter sp.]|nr:hypothetical protein [Turicibacter sp.]